MKEVDNVTTFRCPECHGHGHWYAIRNVARVFKASISTCVAEAGEHVPCPVCKGKGWLDWVENARGGTKYYHGVSSIGSR